MSYSEYSPTDDDTREAFESFPRKCEYFPRPCVSAKFQFVLDSDN